MVSAPATQVAPAQGPNAQTLADLDVNIKLGVTDEDLAKYVKMLKVGLPSGAVEQKMIQDGIATANPAPVLPAPSTGVGAGAPASALPAPVLPAPSTDAPAVASGPQASLVPNLPSPSGPRPVSASAATTVAGAGALASAPQPIVSSETLAGQIGLLKPVVPAPVGPRPASVPTAASVAGADAPESAPQEQAEPARPYLGNLFPGGVVPTLRDAKQRTLASEKEKTKSKPTLGDLLAKSFSPGGRFAGLAGSSGYDENDDDSDF